MRGMELEFDHDIGDFREMAGEPTVANLVNLISSEAVRDRATHPHEPFENIWLRYRVMESQGMPPPFHLRLAIASRIKIMAGMNIAERYVLDGHIRFTLEDARHLRVSCCPTVYGESVACVFSTKEAYSRSGNSVW
jgi:type II secretory ATPase GspE/PulE/Tfp pilus assembly ATPase PilB-like protein